MTTEWKRCSSCKKVLPFGQLYFVCSVSTCNRKRTGMFFCSVECWEEHLPIARHREAWAVEETAPTADAWKAETGGAGRSSGAASPPPPSAAPARPRGPAPVQRRTSGGAAAPVRRRVVSEARAQPEEQDILVVVSRFKAYVKARHGMNTSDGVFELVSDALRRIADEASDHARLDGRKTLLERDFSFLGKKGA